jgi:hypothetical protein
MSEYRTSDIISYALQQKPIEFENSFKSLVQDKLVDAIGSRKGEIAKTLFNLPLQDDEDFDVEQDTEEDQDA